jgi:integrase/recombinase XerC
VVDAAMLVLERMGLTPADLLAAPQVKPAAPTFAGYVPVVSALVSDGCRKAYGSYWNRVVEQWGSRGIDEPTPSEIRQLVQHVRASIVPRRNSRGGRSAAEHLIAALRCLYKHAEEDGLINPADNPARKVEKPRRLPSTRRAVAGKRLAEINHAAAITGDDPELDTLLLRLHTETACRRGGALALRPQDLDPEQCLILLREKGETVRWQPVSPTLMAALLGHAAERHAPPDGQLLRYRTGRRITYRRYDHLWDRLGRHLPWVRAQQISMHWIRHTTLTWVKGRGTSASPSPKPTQATPTPWPVTTIVSCLPVLVLAMGTALAHMLRRCRHRSGRTRQRDRRTSSIAVTCLVRRGPGRCGPEPGRTPGPPGRVQSSPRDHHGPAGPQRQGGNSSSVRHRPGTRGRQQAYSSGKAGIQTGPAQRGNQGLQPGPERPGAHDQCRAGGHSSCPGQTRQRHGANLIPQKRAFLFSSHPRPVASFNPMPAGHDRLLGGNLAGIVACISDRRLG